MQITGVCGSPVKLLQNLFAQHEIITLCDTMIGGQRYVDDFTVFWRDLPITPGDAGAGQDHDPQAAPPG